MNAADHARSIVEEAAAIRVPALLRDAPAIYRMPGRHGIAAVVVRTTDLAQDDLVKLLQFRTAQYLAVGMIDPETVFGAGLRHDPPSSVRPGDVHVIVGSVETGEIYASIWARCVTDEPNATLRSRERASIGKEEVFGRGVFQHLRVLPDLPLGKVRDVGRFIKNQRLAPTSEASVRAPIEAVVALLHAILGPLRPEIHAVVGDIEEGVADKNLDYFHVPTVLVRGVLPIAEEGAWLHRRYLERTCFPYAAVMTDADAVERRLVAIEQALALSGRAAVKRLVALSRDARPTPSSLDAGEAVSTLMAVALPQVGVQMAERLRMIDAGERLRALPLFASLTAPEATTLARLAVREHVVEGSAITCDDDEIVLVDSGSAHVWVRYPHGESSALREVGPGEVVGPVAIATNGACIEQARARSAMLIFRIPGAIYRRHLAHVPAVDRAVVRAGAAALAESLTKAHVGASASGFRRVAV